MLPTLFISALLAAAPPAPPAAHWPAFRGQGNSLAEATHVPKTWSDEQGIAWTLDLAAYGQSSPVVWGDRVFVTSARGNTKQELVVACAEIKTGRKLWERAFPSKLTSPVSDYMSRSAPTPTVDAERVYAFFESGDLIALDHAGHDVWQRQLTHDYGEFLGNHGIGSSLASTNEAIVVLIAHEGPSYLLALDKATGKNRWKIDRPAKVSWSSPIVDERSGKSEIVVSSNGTAEAFDASDGRRLWWLDNLKGNTVPSPTVGRHVIVASADKGQNLAVRRDRAGELGDDAIVWRTTDATASFNSPLIYSGFVYFVNRAGVAFCLSEATGETLWTERLSGSCWASPVGADGRIYFFGKDGVTTVVRNGEKFEKLDENRLTIEDRVYGVAVAPGVFLLRSGQKLICLGKP